MLGSLALGCHSDPRPDELYQRINTEIQQGDLNSALRDSGKAYDRYANKDTEWAWRFRVQKAGILVSRSANAEALKILSEDLPSALKSTDIAFHRKLFQGIAHRAEQQFGEAKKDFDEAEKLSEPLGAKEIAEVLTARAALEIDELDYPHAQLDYDKALSIARQTKSTSLEVGTLADLARLAASQEHYDAAVELNQAALRLAESTQMKGFVPTILGNLGWSYSELGDLENALQFYKEGAEASEKNGLTGYSAYWFTGVANSYLALHDYASAEALSKATLDRARKLNNAQTIGECLNTLAEVTLRTGRLDEAELYNQEALKLEQGGADRFGVLDSIVLSGRIDAKKGRFADAEKQYLRVLNDSHAETAVRWGVQARLAELHDAEGLPARAEQEYRKSIQTFEAARTSVEADDLRLSFLSGAIEFYDDYVDFLIRRGRSEDALMAAELSRAQTLQEGLATGTKTAALASRRVFPQRLAQRFHSTLLFYWMGELHSYLWIITPEKTVVVSLPPAPEIEPLVKSYRKALLASRDPLETANADGRKLYEVLVEPAARSIPQDSRVILLPDGTLYGLNFESLIVPGPQPHYWIDDVTLTTANSLTLLASAAAQPAPKDKNLFLVGNTVSPSADFPALPQASAEMRDVEKYFPAGRRDVLSGSEATPAAYLSNKPEQFAYLHFVAHGTASRTRPLESAVILSKDRNEDSYKLYARDIVKRHLSAYLVTISACNGAGTRAYSGEGLVGLSWAFLRAGAHNVIGALWEVSDNSTPQLMDKLYDGLSHGDDPASALRAAKLSLLHSDSVFRKPYYWAPFQLYAGS
ncbi:MAG: CHAT domain-containing tetratricopeptide repeat protein [Candidatus Acidiferrum sp.]